MATYSNISLERGAVLLEALDRAATPQSLTDIAREVGLNRATTFRLLAVLQQLGYAHKNQRTGRYTLGHKIYAIGRTVRGIETAVDDAAPFVRRLAGELGMTTFVAALQGNQAVVHDKVEPPGGINLHTSIGMRIDAHASSGGKALLASRPAEEVRELYRSHPLYRHTGRTITTLPGLLAELDIIRKRGYAIDTGELIPSVETLAVPVMSTVERALIAISTTGNVSGMSPEGFRARLAAMQRTARQIYAFRVDGIELPD
jgi:IclR family transcriptional regulator, KDG regulon repressor